MSAFESRAGYPLAAGAGEQRLPVQSRGELRRREPRVLYRIEFADGETHVAEFDTAYDSDNAGELEIEMDDPRYDEFHQVVFRIVGESQRGRRLYNEFLAIDYRDFPDRIIDLDSRTVVYPAGGVAST